MTVLLAYYKGDVKPEQRESFDAYVRGVHLPLVAAWPHLKGLRLLKNDRKPYLEEMPQYYQCFELEYDSPEDLAASLASRARAETQEISIRDRARFRDLFDGKVLHMVYETTDFPVAEPGPATLVRCAAYLGRVGEADRARFDDYVREVHMPDVAQWPKLRRLRLLKDEGAYFLGEKPAFYQTFELAFAAQVDMDLCMASEARRETRRIAKRDIGSFKGLFRGEVSHANFVVTEIPLAPA